MNPLCPEAISYLSDKRVGVIALALDDGTPHAATVHFAHAEDVFVFETNSAYRKAAPLCAHKETKASFVVGFVEGPTAKTLQVDGVARLLGEGEEGLRAAYLAKFPEKEAKAEDPTNIFFLLAPAWWRFTDWDGPGGKTIYSSDS